MLIFFLCFDGPSNRVCFSRGYRCDVFKYVFCFFFLAFFRPIFAFSCSLFIGLSIGTVAPAIVFEIFIVENVPFSVAVTKNRK